MSQQPLDGVKKGFDFALGVIVVLVLVVGHAIFT